jgi:hypothetical protein
VVVLVRGPAVWSDSYHTVYDILKSWLCSLGRYSWGGHVCVCSFRGAGVDISSLPCVGKRPMVVVTVQGAPRLFGLVIAQGHAVD